MAVTNQELFNIFLANPNMSDAQIVSLMETRGISPEQISSTFGIPVSEVVSRVAVTVPPGSSVTLGDTRVTPQYQTTGSGMDQQIGGIENIYLEKTTGDVNYKAPVGSDVQVLSPTGELVNTIKTKEDQSFFGGLVDAFKDPVVLAALGGAYAGGLFGGTGALGGATAATGATALTAAEAAGLGLSAAEAASLGLSASEFAAAGGLGAGFTAAGLPSGVGTFLGENVVSGIPAFDTAFTSAGGLFNPAFGLPVGNGAFLGEGVPTGIPASDALYLNAGGVFNPAYALGADGLIGTPLITSPVGTPPAGTSPPTSNAPPTSVPPVGVPPVVSPTGISPTISTIAKSLIPTAVSSLFSPTNTGNLSNLFSGGLGTAGSLLQMQQSKEAALAAQQRIDAETAAAKQSAAFRPIGMTTRFGTSQFAVDPVTGQLTSAGYALSPEAKAQQDRFVALSQQGLTQAEGAQAQFAPLQTGAQRLFGLGNQYLAQSPQDVAQNYLNQQMQLLKPGREVELANLQNRLQQQGRGGLSVAQGGTMGATTPELQALYNARAQQEAQLAANAQQYGQQQVSFGAGLLGQGSQAMGQYYGGQQAAYAPYTTAMGQVQGLEALGQQPFTLGAQLGQTASTAGARVGQLGLQGAGQSVALATGADATRNLGAQSLIAAGNPNAQFGQSIGGLLGGFFGSGAPVNALSSSGYGPGNAGFQNMIDDIYGERVIGSLYS